VAGDEQRPLTPELVELPLEQLLARLVERVARLVENQQLGVVQERPAERQALQHSARIGARPLRASLPEPEALEQHPDPLAPFGHPVETAIEVKVLDRRQLPVDERLMCEVADLAAFCVDLELARGRDQQAGAEAQQRRLARAVRAGDDEEAAAHKLEVDRLERALVAEAPGQPARPDHGTPSSARCSRTSAASSAECGLSRSSIFSSGSGYDVARIASAAAARSYSVRRNSTSG